MISAMFWFGFENVLFDQYFFQKSESTFSVAFDGKTVSANFVSEEEVRCELPTVDSYEVAVSLNGSTTSNAVQFIVYNSLCENCTKDTCIDRVSSSSSIRFYKKKYFSTTTYLLYGIKSQKHINEPSMVV